MMNNLTNSFESVPAGLIILFFIIACLFFLALIIGMVVLKGYALWTAAKRDEKGWFIALLVINTLGILELIYLTFVAEVWKKKKSEFPATTPSAPGSKL